MVDQLKVLRGLEILQLYKPDGATWECDAQHDMLYATGLPPEDIDSSALRELRELGMGF
jgi:hypothetical protein